MQMIISKTPLPNLCNQSTQASSSLLNLCNKKDEFTLAVSEIDKISLHDDEISS